MGYQTNNEWRMGKRQTSLASWHWCMQCRWKRPCLVVDDELQQLADSESDDLVLRLCQGYQVCEDILHARHLVITKSCISRLYRNK